MCTELGNLGALQNSCASSYYRPERPKFGRLVNPIQTSGGRLCTTAPRPRIQKAIYTSAGYHYYLTVHRHCVTFYGPDGNTCTQRNCPSVGSEDSSVLFLSFSAETRKNGYSQGSLSAKEGYTTPE